MTFNSLHFIAFFAIVVAGFTLLRRRVVARNTFLLLASWYFYDRVTGDVRWLLLLLGTQVFDYSFARLIERYPMHSRGRKWCVVGSCTVNLLVLGFFKYCNFFVDNVVLAANEMGWHATRPVLHVILPAGISFYTFQSMSYVIDVYRGHLKAEKHVLHYALFVAFFPQLIAGPIERATHLLPQIKSEQRPRWDDFCHGAWLIWLGLFKKVVLADNISHVAKAVFDKPDVFPRPWESMIGVYAFALQIYCDFSAYSDIARGAARIMGFDLMRNFDLPYFAVNPSDFWRRWHISLSTWLRDYLYIPLGGNRGGILVRPVARIEEACVRLVRFWHSLWRRTTVRDDSDFAPKASPVLDYERATVFRPSNLGVQLSHYLNLFLTMLLGGLWHGATWLFVAWGAYHGTMLCVHRAVSPLMKRYFTFTNRTAAALWTTLRIVVFFQFTCVGWLLFRGTTLTNLQRMLTPFVSPQQPGVPLVTPDLMLTFVAVALALLIPQLVKYVANDHNVVFRVPVPLRAALYAGMILAFLIYGVFDGGDFIYFQF